MLTAAAPPAPDAGPTCAEGELSRLVHAARAGDESAWPRLVAQFDPMVRRIARGFRLAPNDVDDVAQATWLKLVAHIGRIREPEALWGWIGTTARREALGVHQASSTQWLTADPAVFEAPDDEDPEAQVLAADSRAVLERAMATLPERQRALLTLIVGQERSDYQAISDALEMPIGSIGPTRRRSLERLQRHAEIRALRP